MKKFLLTTSIASALFVACAKDDGAGAAVLNTACGGAYNGVWLGPSAKLYLYSDCTIQFLNSPYCSSTGTYSAILGTSGAVNIEITAQVGGTNCPSVGRFQCAYILSDSLTLDCGGGSVGYSKVIE